MIERTVDTLAAPSWFNPVLVGNPRFSPNADFVQREAEVMRDNRAIKPPQRDERRVLVFNVDYGPDFTWPLTEVDVATGKIIRHVQFDDPRGLPSHWSGGGNLSNELRRYHPGQLDVNSLLSIAGGRLSVPGAWDDVWRSCSWDLDNAAFITRIANVMDFHPLTSRWDMHYWVLRHGNPYGFPADTHPFGFMDGPDKPFPVITPNSMWHPVYNPEGWFKPVVSDRLALDEGWNQVTKGGVIVLWFKHMHRFTSGAILDPLVMATTMHHAFVRGGVAAEPAFYMKGVSWRSDSLGMFESDFPIEDDQDAQPIPSMTQLMKGDRRYGIPGYDLTVWKGEAWTHCVPRAIKQAVANLKLTGNGHRIKDIVVLRDCCSSIPGFEDQAEKEWVALQAEGVRIETTQTFNLYDL